MKAVSVIVFFAAMAVVFLGPSAVPTHAGNPCPFHTIEGVSGGAITPMACMTNNEPAGALFKKPSVSLSFVNLNDKDLEAMVITERLGERFEWGYAADRLGLGSLPGDIREATHGTEIGRDDVWLHNFNLRMMLVDSNTTLGGLTLPEVTMGVHFKVNHGIREIDNRLGGALSDIGFARANGTDFTLTATRSIMPPKGSQSGPLLLTAGFRLSEAAQLGLLGFGDAYYGTFEGSICYFPRSWLCFAYEFRQKADPYDRIPGLIGEEESWHAIDVALILDDHATLCAGYGHFGMVANEKVDNAWFLQLKRNF